MHTKRILENSNFKFIFGSMKVLRVCVTKSMDFSGFSMENNRIPLENHHILMHFLNFVHRTKNERKINLKV